MDRTNGKFGKFRPFMVIGNLIMAVSILALYCVTPLIPDTMMWARYAMFVALYAVWGHRLHLPDQLHPFRADRSDQRPQAAPAVHDFLTPSVLCWVWARCSSSPPILAKKL